MTDGEGNPVTQILSGFKAELMTRTSGFDRLPKYDAKGNECTYRVRETAVTVNGQEAVMSADGSYFTVDGYEFTVDYHDADNRISNTLVGDTEFQIRKVWNPEVPEGETASITVRLYRNGTPFVPEQRMLPTGAVLNADGTLTLNNLPASIDVGISFTTAAIPSPIPQTGDMLSLAQAFGGLCLAGLLLIVFRRRKRSK